jgi:hypothetical protein
MVGRLNGPEQRRLMVNTGGVLMSKTLEMGNEVFLAMQARGFRGEVRLLTNFRLRGWDYVAMMRLCGRRGIGGCGGTIERVKSPVQRAFCFPGYRRKSSGANLGHPKGLDR